MAPNLQLTYLDRVLLEIIETERMYVRDLRMIVEDYLAHIIDQCDLLIGPEQVCALFGNIEDIYEFSSELLQALDLCDNDAVAVARCFVMKGEFFEIYTQYCTNYPSSVLALTECMRNQSLAAFFRERQASLNCSLPLGSYLLKPVQRILKYHLLLQEIAKHFDPEEQGYEVVEEAIYTMTGVAWYINDMKRKHEHAIRLQEVQSLLLHWKGPDLTTYGELVLEGTFKVHRAKNERTLFLFERVLLITKRRGDHFVYKTHICCSTLMLIESAKDSLSFSVTHYKHPKQPLTVQAKTVEERKLWAHHIKRIILENHHAIIPQKAKDAIMETKLSYAPRYRHSPDRTRGATSCPPDSAQQDAARGRSGTAAAPVLQTAAEVEHSWPRPAAPPPSLGQLCATAEIQDPGGGVTSPDGPPSEDGPNGTKTTFDPTEELLLQEATEEPAEEPAELEPTGRPELLRTCPHVSESPLSFEDQTCDRAPESMEKVSPAAGSSPKVLSSEESSEDEEAVGDSVEPGGQSPRLLPSSVLDRAGAIAHHFSNSIRRSSLTQEDVRLLGCASPRPHGPTSSLRRQPGPPQPADTTETDLAGLSPGEDSFWDVVGGPGRRRDSTLSKQDQLLISKIKTYYEKAGSQSPTLCLQRRESLTSIPAGLVRSSVSRINSIPQVDSTSWGTPPGPSTVLTTEDQPLPDLSDPLRLELRSSDDLEESQTSRPSSPSKEEKFIPSSQMIRIWQTMEQKITLAQPENKISKLQEAPQSFRPSCFKVSESGKFQNEDSPPDSRDLQKTKVFEEELFVLRAPGHQGSQTKAQAGGEERKSKVLHLARQYSQKIKTSRPVVRQRSQGLLLSQNPLACVMEEVEKMESSDKPRLDLRNQAGPSALSRPVGDCPPEDRPGGDRPPEDRPGGDRPPEDRPGGDRPPEDRPGGDRPAECRAPADCPPEDRPTCRLPYKEVISTDQVQAGSLAQSSSSTEAFDWPDVQRLRCRYSSGGRRRALSHTGSELERLSARRHSSCSCLVLPEGPCLEVPSTESGDGRDADAEECGRRLQRAASGDLLSSRTRAEAPQQLASLSCGYFVADETPRPDDPERSVIVLEKVQEAVDTAEEEGEENYVQIRSPTSKEKISLVAVIDRCRVYQGSDPSPDEAKGRVDGARAPECPRAQSRQDSSKQGRVKSLRDKFQNMS